METLQRPLVLSDNCKMPTASTFSTLLSPSATSASSSSSQEDLLADLWLETPPKAQHYAPALLPLSASPNSVWPTTPMDAAHAPRYPAPCMKSTAVLRDESLEYAQLLLPHSLLAPLTEENLGYNQTHGDFSDEIFSFEQQHAPAPPHTGHTHAPRKPKCRHGSVSLLLSLLLGKNQKNLNTQLYKTELCVSFIKMGVCPYGNKCQFAHGQNELKSVERPANWRSKPCANWARYGLCRYGKRCCFKHGE